MRVMMPRVMRVSIAGVRVVMRVGMVVSVRLSSPVAYDHDHADDEHNGSGYQQKVRFGGFRNHLVAKLKCGDSKHPDNQGV